MVEATNFFLYNSRSIADRRAIERLIADTLQDDSISHYSSNEMQAMNTQKWLEHCVSPNVRHIAQYDNEHNTAILVEPTGVSKLRSFSNLRKYLIERIVQEPGTQIQDDQGKQYSIDQLFYDGLHVDDDRFNVKRSVQAAGTTFYDELNEPVSDHEWLTTSMNMTLPKEYLIHQYVCTPNATMIAVKSFEKRLIRVIDGARICQSNALWTNILQTLFPNLRETIIKASSLGRPVLYMHSIEDTADFFKLFDRHDVLIEEWRGNDFTVVRPHVLRNHLFTAALVKDKNKHLRYNVISDDPEYKYRQIIRIPLQATNKKTTLHEFDVLPHVLITTPHLTDAS